MPKEVLVYADAARETRQLLEMWGLGVVIFSDEMITHRVGGYQAAKFDMEHYEGQAIELALTKCNSMGMDAGVIFNDNRNAVYNAQEKRGKFGIRYVYEENVPVLHAASFKFAHKEAKAALKEAIAKLEEG